MTTAVVSPDDLLEIAEMVWSSYLDPEGEAPLLPAATDAEIEVCAAVSVTGAWRGHVVLECSAEASRLAAAALLAIEAGDVTGEDVVDALGELANVFGGNVKSLLPEPSALSLPYVITANAAATRWPLAVEVCRLAGSWQDQPVVVTVLESTNSEGASAA